MTTHHPLAVLGGGLGGLTLARVLHRHGIDVPVHELDASPAARRQGGMLDIHEDTGQQALRAAGLHREFLDRVHAGGQAVRVLDRDARVRLDEPDDGTGDRPEIDRGELRDLLLDSLPAGTVRWGARAVGCRALAPGGPYEVELADGSSFTADVLVGADGAWSRVRPLLSPAVPAYTGISFVEFDLPEADVRHPAEAGTVGGGMFFGLGGDAALLAHRETDGSLHVYAGVRAEESWLDSAEFTGDPEAALLARFDGWAPELRALITGAEGPLVPRRIHALPAGHTWQRTPGLTLLGDAAHLMSPFAGEGANLALADAADLGLALVAAGIGNAEEALAAYETRMFPRARAAARASAQSMELIFHPEAPGPLLEMFAGHGMGPAEKGPDTERRGNPPPVPYGKAR